MRRSFAILLCSAIPAVGMAQKAADPLRSVAVDKVAAVVGTHPVLMSEVLDRIAMLRSQGAEVPPDSAGQMAMARDVLNIIIDEEALIAAAKQFKIDVPETDVNTNVEKKFKEIRARVKSDPEWRSALKREGFGTEGEFRKYLADGERRSEQQRIGIDSLKAHGRFSAPVQVTEKEIDDGIEKVKDRLPKRPTAISFKQVVIAPRANAANEKLALDKAQAILDEVKKGGDFEQIAKRESMDPGPKERGGDLGWNRRGVMVPEFDRAMFAFGPGQIVPVVIKTTLGYHVIKVDRVQPAEVKARHVLIMPKLDSADVARAHTLADSVQKLWKGGMPYDSVVAKFHDNGELTSYADQYPIDSLPPEYKTAAGDAKSGEFGKLFEIANPQTGFPKVVVLRVTERTEGGAMTKADIRDRIRQQLVQEKQYRRMYDQLRKEQYVVIRM
jgi:peptidyl-prolyl cis-trans isomerase SurA